MPVNPRDLFNMFGMGDQNPDDEGNALRKMEMEEIEKAEKQKDLALALGVKSKRPNRETPISKDEVINLTIALENAQTIDDVLKAIK